MRFNRLFAALLLLLFASVPALAQQDDPTTEFGLKPFGSFQGGDIDNVNLLNGWLNVHIPLVSYPQRGGKLKLSFSAVYLGPTLTWIDDNCSDNGRGETSCNQDWSMSGQAITIVADGVPNLNFPPQSVPTGLPLLLTVPDGTAHPVYKLSSTTALTSDASGYSVKWGGSNPCDGPNGNEWWTITDNLGNSYSYTLCGTFNSMKDVDGNTITVNYGTTQSGAYEISSFTDTLGRTIPYSEYMPGLQGTSNLTGCTGILPSSGGAYTWTIPAPGGGTATYKMCQGIVSINLPGCTDDADIGGNGSPTRCTFDDTGIVTQSIVRPDGSAWTFNYDSSNTTSAYGDLTAITFPTGGSINYVWHPLPSNLPGESSDPTFMPRGVQTRATNANDGSGPQQWTYSTTVGSGSTPPITTTVLDPLANQTVHTLSVADGDYFETQTQYYQGTQTLLQTVTTQYSSSGGAVPTVVTTAWPNGQVSQIQTDYAFDAGSGLTFGNEIAKRVYDYGSGAPGPLLRQTITSYEYQVSNAYKMANLVTLPSNVTVKDGTGVQYAYTYYAYDESNGSPQCTCGNQTSVHDWLNTNNSYLTTKKVFNSNGLIVTTTNPNGNNKTFGYAPTQACSSGYAGSGPTSLTNSLAQTTYYCDDFNTGLQTLLTDANGLTTTYAYDQMLRATSITYPQQQMLDGTWLNGSKSFNYPSTNEVQIDQLMDDQSHSNITLLVVDGLGREIQQATSNGESTPYDQVDTCYDALGRINFKSYPYQGGGIPSSRSCSGTGDSTSYDPLGRITAVTHSDGTSSSTSYTGRATSVLDEGNGTQRVQRISQVDGLGHTTSVCEVSSTSLTVGVSGSTVPSACGLDISGTGFLTNYTYDPLDDLKSVIQGPLATRTFTYDSLARLSTAVNPEANWSPSSGTYVATTYAYDGDGNVLTRVDARGVMTTYSYNVLDQITGKTYSDGTPTVTYNYNQTSANGVSLTNTTGRMSSESTSGVNPTGAVFSYDAMGRVVNNSQCTPQNCTASTYPLIYAYDLLGDVTYSTNGANANGGNIGFSYSYNAGQRLTQLSSSLNDAQHPGIMFSGAHYNASGSLISVLLGNGTSESRTYDSRSRLCSIQDGSIYTLAIPGPSPCPSGSLNGYAPDSDILATNDSVNGDWTYGYDPFNRLSGANQNNGAVVYTYSYDRFGNRWIEQATAGSGAYSNLSFDANNRTTPDTSTLFDADGNVLNDGVHGYFYDAENRLIQVDGSAGYCATGSGTSATACYFYDSEGRRVRKSASSSTMDFLYDLGNGEITQMNSGLWSRGEVYAGSRHIATYSAGTTYFDDVDWLGTERLRSTVTGTSCETMTNLPFGDGENFSGSCGDPSPMHFTGKEWNSESNLSDFEARFHSSAMGRFMSPDWSEFPDPVPFASPDDPQLLNLYGFVRDNPLGATDPDGHHLECTTTNTTGTFDGAPVIVQINVCHEVPDPPEFKGVMWAALVGGHHFVDQSLLRAEGAWDDNLAGQFFRRWLTGALDRLGVHKGFSTPHRLNSQQVRAIIEDVEAETETPMKDWNEDQIRLAVGKVQNAGGDIKAFTDQIAEENPNARTLTDDIEPIMNEAKQAMGYVEQFTGGVIDDVQEACTSEPDCGFPPP
jgi:RHS repeat-associated protein